VRPEHRDRAKALAARRVTERYLEEARERGEEYLEGVLNDTLYHEQRRLERENPGDPKTRAELAFYQSIRRELRELQGTGPHAMLERVARRFSDEIVGNFDERVYQLTTTVVPAGLSVLLSAASPRQLLSGSIRQRLGEHLQIQGAVDQVRQLLEKGTLIVVPTHSSHLDSIVLGYAIYLMGMPPLLYGAGLNLFTNPLTSFFMHNLGAYRVDRKKSAALYKDVLKEYATVSLELGYSNLFFPGGTRSRSGAVEQKLKKGLLGTGLEAYVNNLRAKHAKPNLYVVPATISYKLVLEAETLIDDYLKEIGKSRYIIEDDEFSKPRKVLKFLSNIMSLDSRIVITFSAPLDIVGNRVDSDGRSIDTRGRAVDPFSYVARGGEPVHDDQRDNQYTNELSEAIVGAFRRDNVVMSTHVVGHASMALLRQKNPELDLYRLLRTGGSLPSLEISELAEQVERVTAALRDNPNGPRLGRELEQSDARMIIDDALRYFGTYHTQPAAIRRGSRFVHQHRNLLLYYGNRLNGYDLGRRLGGAYVQAA
jgi:glycerol-3-phosphate O-acyltransferase